ncbi:MAG: multiple antibiotic resistance protein [Thermoplasmata archaeon]|jgi:multiple antibiotic resistance protein|nr:multiple antibiotic resistance protein [Thermoplasmata archaeon]
MDPQELVLALVPLFVVVDPLASIGLYLGLTARADRPARDRIALKACMFAAAVLLLFAVAGQALLRHLGIELYSLRVAGGILLVLIGLNMLREGEEVPLREIAEGELEVTTGGTHRGGPVAHDPSLVPLGLPMLAGPGAISLVIVQGTRHDLATISVAILLAMVGALAILLATARASHIIGDNGRRVITRIMGLLTVAFAVQYVLDGIDGWLAARA